MTPKEKAIELVNKFKDHVNPYVGSGMLSNNYDDATILFQSKQCALIVADEILKYISDLPFKNAHKTFNGTIEIYNWQQVKQEIELL